MAQDTYNLCSFIVGLVGVIVLAWYTIETQRLRKTSQRQVDVSERQAQLFAEQASLSIRPFLICKVTDAKPGSGWMGVLWNPTDRVAHDIRVFICEETGYYWSDESPVLIKMGEHAQWVARGPVVGDNPFWVLESVYDKTRIRSQLQFLEQQMRDRDTAIFFRDINGNIHMYFALMTLYHGDWRLRSPQLLSEAHEEKS